MALQAAGRCRMALPPSPPAARRERPPASCRSSLRPRPSSPRPAASRSPMACAIVARGRTRGAGRALSRGPARRGRAASGSSHRRRPMPRAASGFRSTQRRAGVPGGVHARGVAGRRRDPRRGSARPLLRRRHALAARDRGRRRLPAPPTIPALRIADGAALRLARTHARFGAALPASRIHPAAHRLDGAAQAQRTALAPDRRPGLAARDPPLPRARRGDPGALAASPTGDRRSAASTAATTRRTRCATSSPTRPHASSRSSRRSRCPAMRRPRSRATRGSARAARRRPSRRTGACTTISSTPTSRHSTFLEDVLAEVIELFPGEYVHVGGDEAVKDRWQIIAARAGAHPRARPRGRGGAAGLVRRAHRPLPRRARTPADRLGRDPRQRHSGAREPSCPGAAPHGAIAAARAGTTS